MAVTMVVFYKEPADREKFEQHYMHTHIPLVHKMPGLQKFEVSRFTSKEAPYYLMATLYFENKEALQAAASSPEGQAAAADVANFAAPDSVTNAFAEIL
ncbi:EthD family reductase [Dictyobacter arantiisoli]|uniref:Putative ethyl tert-butyl ether degradation protein EthD n=1 Tax=Dictyobacter arantiisoli TaxID=2014874 RepID=A0A5A5TE04_9CHLR|nr:EthD family reductase [Dictyobacter arantiisoli]GCF09124.1 putative ethyl tert-butyl ether degradation protein EthD [Dictyobacter arantiisoli]